MSDPMFSCSADAYYFGVDLEIRTSLCYLVLYFLKFLQAVCWAGLMLFQVLSFRKMTAYAVVGSDTETEPGP
jgi:hypothetical protein